MITKDAIEDYFFEASITFLIGLQENLNTLIENVFIKIEENQKLVELNELLLVRMTKVEREIETVER
jgi:hypothetical protein